jgi:hypothetical protein
VQRVVIRNSNDLTPQTEPAQRSPMPVFLPTYPNPQQVMPVPDAQR